MLPMFVSSSNSPPARLPSKRLSSEPEPRESAKVSRPGDGKRRRLESQAYSAASEPPVYSSRLYYAPVERGAERQSSWPNAPRNGYSGYSPPGSVYGPVTRSSLPGPNPQLPYNNQFSPYPQDFKRPSPGFIQSPAPPGAPILSTFNANAPFWNPANINPATDYHPPAYVNPPFFSPSYSHVSPDMNPMLPSHPLMNSVGGLEAPPYNTSLLRVWVRKERGQLHRPLLVILDLNGTLILRKHKKLPPSYTRRAGLDHFLDKLTSNYSVMIWTSSKPATCNAVCDELFPATGKRKLVARWDREKFGLTPRQYNSKLQVYKELHKVWEDPVIRSRYPGNKPIETGGKPGGKFARKKLAKQIAAVSASKTVGQWDQTNTVLIDDSKLKAISEPYNILEIPEFTNDATIDESDLFAKVLGRLHVLARHDDVSKVLRVWNERLADSGGNILDLDISPEKPDEPEIHDSEDSDIGGGTPLLPPQQPNNSNSNSNPASSRKKDRKNKNKPAPSPEEKAALKEAKKARKKARKAEKKEREALAPPVPSKKQKQAMQDDLSAEANALVMDLQSAPQIPSQQYDGPDDAGPKRSMPAQPVNQRKKKKNSKPNALLKDLSSNHQNTSDQREAMNAAISSAHDRNAPRHNFRPRNNPAQTATVEAPSAGAAVSIPGLVLSSPAETAAVALEHGHVDTIPAPLEAPRSPSPLTSEDEKVEAPDADSVYSPTSFAPAETEQPEQSAQPEQLERPDRPASPAISSVSGNSLLDRLEDGLGLRV
ncbi:hypothetical protein N7468_000405 [Penicillium chermesinum]|uniref:FCP1 homology domain-containing protein n=1 Tax=Penicillium chermesinum TaxID=63820 RepID=A0A9W9PLI7_9EURO|nr:uncharacterized protein N7468_000405 [Penicillium chermesinum]KAJ5248954.1 hypothetical protein N7468_000405 [Penicillium chermesinum]